MQHHHHHENQALLGRVDEALSGESGGITGLCIAPHQAGPLPSPHRRFNNRVRRHPPLRFWCAAFFADVLATLGLPAGELALVFFSLVIWRRCLASKALASTAQLDNSSTLDHRQDLQRSNLQPGGSGDCPTACLGSNRDLRALPQHSQVEADALSSISEGKEVPQRLRRVPRNPFPEEPLQALAMRDWPRAEGLKKEKKEKRKRRQEEEARAPQGSKRKRESTLAASSDAARSLAAPSAPTPLVQCPFSHMLFAAQDCARRSPLRERAPRSRAPLEFGLSSSTCSSGGGPSAHRRHDGRA